MAQCKGLGLLLKLSVFFLQLSAILAPSTSGQVCAIAQGKEAKAARLAALQLAFGKEPDHRLDLIFVIDRSNSIGEYEFNETKQFLRQIITYMSRQRHILVKRTSTRITVLSFGIQATPEFDGISEAGSAIDACVLQTRINGLRLLNNKTLASELPRALSRARDILARSRSNGAEDDVKQIVWIFFDGAEGRPLSYDGKTSNDWARELRNDNVVIFSVGVGAWLKVSIERENRVAELATARDHYACLETWAEILENSPSSLENGGSSEPVYETIAEVYKDKCGSCPKGRECACDVINMNYACASDELYRKKSDQPDGATDSTLPVNRTPSWLLPVVIGVALFLFMIITVVVVCVVKKKRNTREKKEGNTSDGGSQKNSETRYATSIIRPETDAMEEQVDEDYPDISVYQNIDLEEQMPGWSEYLFELKNENHLLNLGIMSVDGTKWAVTPGFKLSVHDVKTIRHVLDSGSHARANKKLKIAGKTYVVDVYQGEVTDHHLHAFRLNRKHLKQCTWIARAKDYIIIGLAEENEDKVCSDIVYKIYRQFDPMPL